MFASELDSLKQLLNSNLTEYDQRIRVYKEITKLYLSQNLDSSKRYTNLALQEAKLMNDPKGIAWMYNRLARIEIMKDNFLEAKKQLNLALGYFEGTEFEHEFSRIWHTLGNIYNWEGNYPLAIQYFQKGLSAFEKNKDSVLLATINISMGAVSTRLKDNAQALEYHLKSLEIVEAIKDTTLQILALTNIGSAYLNLDYTDSTRKYLYKALELSKSYNSSPSQADVYNRLGALELKLEDFETALKFYYQALKAVKQIDNSYSGSKSHFLAATYDNIGNAYLNLSNEDSAIKNFKFAKGYIENENFASLYSQIALGLSKAYETKNKFDSALYYYKIYNNISDSLINSENIRETTRLEIQYKYDKEIEKQEIEHRLAVTLQKKRSLVINLISLGVFLILLILFLSYRNALKRKSEMKRKQAELTQKNLQIELDYKDKELVTNTMYLLKKSEFIQNIGEKLKDFIEKLSQDNQKYISEIITEIYQNSSEIDWKDFETRFHKVHVDFNEKLIRKSPSLTPNELKLCAFLKLNLTTKEIAAITYQSINSLEVARYRLRKKLGLENYENLIEFLNKVD
ncbi:MAG: tetratricopeptide repeat protein [Bacteroidales bacterium]|nr:tetratricopeptide repeat protein [Bacteroidales bacterium]MCF8456427.1 tetratricopeptide repeat protein [Bacteroidales bacterium]